jgi:hypothetical protein
MIAGTHVALTKCKWLHPSKAGQKGSQRGPTVERRLPDRLKRTTTPSFRRTIYQGLRAGGRSFRASYRVHASTCRANFTNFTRIHPTRLRSSNPLILGKALDRLDDSGVPFVIFSLPVNCPILLYSGPRVCHADIYVGLSRSRSDIQI